MQTDRAKGAHRARVAFALSDGDHEEGSRSVIIEVRVAPDDMGKLIGRQGRTVRALRSLFHAVSMKQGRRYILEIVE